MKVKSVLRTLFFGGVGTLIVGFSTGNWFQGLIFCMTLASIGEYSSLIRKNTKE